MQRAIESDLKKARKFCRERAMFTNDELGWALKSFDDDVAEDVISDLWRNGEISGVAECAENIYRFNGSYYEPRVIFLRVIRRIRLWWHYKFAHTA